MQNPIENYWRIKLQDLKKKLEVNGFEVFLAQTSDEASSIVFQTIVPASSPKSVSWGGSVTLRVAGIPDVLRTRTDFTVLDAYDPALSAAEVYELRRQALLVDLYFAGTNAVTEDGQLVNLDAFGNRVAALSFGPKTVVVLVGRNKLVPGLNEAMDRVKNLAAPANAMRLDKKTPCLTTALCHDCRSMDRICNVWTITERSFPKGRIKVILINQDLGF